MTEPRDPILEETETSPSAATSSTSPQTELRTFLIALELRDDEALVVFVSARRALRAALDLQARFAEDKLPRGVGIGLDAGEAIPVCDGYRGTALNLAARLSAKAGPGETLAPEAVIHLAAKVDGIVYVDARELHVKAMPRPSESWTWFPRIRPKAAASSGSAAASSSPRSVPLTC